MGLCVEQDLLIVEFNRKDRLVQRIFRGGPVPRFFLLGDGTIFFSPTTFFLGDKTSFFPTTGTWGLDGSFLRCLLLGKTGLGGTSSRKLPIRGTGGCGSFAHRFSSGKTMRTMPSLRCLLLVTFSSAGEVESTFPHAVFIDF